MTPSPSHRLIDRLVADARPVARLWPPQTRLALWLLLQSAVVAVVLASVPSSRVLARVEDTRRLVEVLLFAGAAVVLAAGALAAAVPGREPDRAFVAVAGLAALVAVQLGALDPAEPGVSIAAFLAAGVPCALRTVAIALVPAAALFVAVGRGAPLRPGRAGALAGGAALVATHVAMRLACPIEDALHVLCWHALPVALGTAAAATIGTTVLARWRRAAPLSDTSPSAR